MTVGGVTPKSRSIVVIVRHPDEALEVETFYCPSDIQIIELDLGSCFDITRPNVDDQPAVIEWIQAVREDVEDLPADHPARINVEAIIANVMDTFNLGFPTAYRVTRVDDAPLPVGLFHLSSGIIMTVTAGAVEADFDTREDAEEFVGKLPGNEMGIFVVEDVFDEDEDDEARPAWED